MHVPLNELTAASDHSRFVQRIRRRYAGQLALLPAGEPVRASMQAAYEALLPLEADTGVRLRILRQLVLERLVVLDCDMAPTLVASRTALPPGGAELARGGPSRRWAFMRRASTFRA